MTHLNLNFCFDVGHAHMDEERRRRRSTCMKKRIRSTHMHDNDGKDDKHLFPLVGRRRHHRLEADRWSCCARGRISIRCCSN